jgi:hypothetical protein
VISGTLSLKQGRGTELLSIGREVKLSCAGPQEVHTHLEV